MTVIGYHALLGHLVLPFTGSMTHLFNRAQL